MDTKMPKPFNKGSGSTHMPEKAVGDGGFVEKCGYGKDHSAVNIPDTMAKDLPKNSDLTT